MTDGTPTWLAEGAAFRAIARRLRGAPSAEQLRFEEPSFRRLWSALEMAAGDPHRPGPLEIAVLVRQVLRYEQLRTRRDEHLHVPMGAGWPTPADWASVGVRSWAHQDFLRIEADPWRPTWLRDVGPDGVDGAAVARVERGRPPPVEGDPFLARVAQDSSLRSTYLSAGQRAAMRAVLTTPRGATLVVSLPTGDGKSLVFHTLASVGFGEEGEGTTVVVVPTRALAEDHEYSSRELLGLLGPLAHLGDRTEQNKLIEEGILAGTQRLCFVSPEAIRGSLRWVLERATQSGRLRALVVDEAHLVDAWGVNFRPEFQTLAGIRRELLALAGPERGFRTYLLSATLTEQALDTLRRFFGTDDRGDATPFEVSAAVRLRPEIDYWVADLVGADERRVRVDEALLHCPRPAILYVTRVDDAVAWHERLQTRGFRRLACVTGKSTDDERASAVRGWRLGHLDLVVATSAFGLGVDNREVRAVIHVCLPETLDRFYQEVGRGGRDGRASLSLLLPSDSDSRLAQHLNRPELITVERGLQRWRAMFEHPSRRQDDHDPTCFTLRLDIAPGTSDRDIDMLNEQSTQWNARTLNLMQAAGLVALRGVGPPRQEAAGEEAPKRGVWHLWQTIRTLGEQHLNPTTWEQLVEPIRQQLATAARASLAQMTEVVEGRRCVGSLLAELYRVPADATDADALIAPAAACGGCPACRAAGCPPRVGYSAEPISPWKPTESCERLLVRLGGQRGILFCPRAVLQPGNADGVLPWRRRLVDQLAELVRAGMRNVVLLGETGVDLHRLDRDAGVPFFVARHRTLHRLPHLPTIVVTASRDGIPAAEFRRPADSRTPCLYVLPDDFVDSDRPDQPLRRTAPPPTHDLGSFVRDGHRGR